MQPFLQSEIKNPVRKATSKCLGHVESLSIHLKVVRSIATGFWDRIICIWRLKDGAEMMKQMEKNIGSLEILQNGKRVVTTEGLFPSADDIHMEYWKPWVRDTESGKAVAGPLDAHTNVVRGLDVSPDGEILASGSWDLTVILWDTNSWLRKGGLIWCRLYLLDVRFSPSGQPGITLREVIQIWDLERRDCFTQFRATPISKAYETCRSPGLPMCPSPLSR
jgi:WD40 repeat protein